jgi:hypothetical protein
MQETNMFRLAILAIIFAALASTAHAAPATPEAMVRRIYDRLIAASAKDGAYDPSADEVLSPRLTSLEAAARKAAGTDVPCGLDFSIWFDGQEYGIKSADVSVAPGATADRQVIVAKFDNLGTAHELHFTFRRRAGRWKLDDAESVVGTKWVFSRLLQCKD